MTSSTKEQAQTATPGPWQYEFGHDMASGVRYWQVHNGYDAICCNQFCYAAQGDEGVSEANARLIAAAPDMLSKLVEIRKWMDADVCGPWDAKFITEIDELVARATGAAR